MWALLSALAAPLISLALQVSRRTRLVNRIRSYVQLAGDIEIFDPDGAAQLRDLAKQSNRQLIDGDRASLSNRFDAGSAIAILLLLVPSVILFAWAATVDEWWAWPLFLVAVLWGALAVVAGWQELWKPHEESLKDDSN